MTLSQSVSDFISDYTGDTPHLVVSLDKVDENYITLHSAMPEAHHYYAIKANPDRDILRRIQKQGGYFECASIPEIDMCLEVGVKPVNILYGNPLKKASEIQAAYARGIRQYVFDAEQELEKLIAYAPNSKVLCRIITDGVGAVSPLSVKFGCPPDKAYQWLLKAHNNGLVAYGISFHTGSQQLDPDAWSRPIESASSVFSSLAREGVHTMRVLNVGGGFPVSYRTEVPSIDKFTAKISQYVAQYFGHTKPLIYTEPGPYMLEMLGLLSQKWC